MLCKKCKKREAVCEHHTKFDKVTGKSDKDSPIQNLCVFCHSKIHGIEPRQGELRRLVVLLTRNQKTQYAINNQIRSFSRIELTVPKYLKETSERFKEEEKRLEKEISHLLGGKDQKSNETQKVSVQPFPIWSWLKEVKGVSVRLGAKIISMVDIKNTPAIANLWSFCGQTPDSRLKKGQKIKHNPELKSYMFQLGESFIIHKSPYKKIYDVEKEKQLKLMDDANHQMKPMLKMQNPEKEESHIQYENHVYLASPPKNKMHAHLRAMRKMNKKFLKDLWLKWREIEGLTITDPFEGPS